MQMVGTPQIGLLDVSVDSDGAIYDKRFIDNCQHMSAQLSELKQTSSESRMVHYHTFSILLDVFVTSKIDLGKL